MKMAVINTSQLVRIACMTASAGLLAGCLSQSPVDVRSAGEAGVQPQPTMSQPGEQYHVVRQGDTLMGIGRTYNRNISDLIVWNELQNPHQIRVGQRILVSPPGSAAPGGEDGVVVMPIDMGGSATTPSVSGTPSVVQDPKGGRTPYSDDAWAAARPGADGSAPSVIPKPPATPDAPPAQAGAAWQWPAGGQILARFDEATNKGVSIAGNPGDPVRASKAGSVVYSGSGLRGYGKLVIIKHDDDYLTAYAHNQTLLVKEGDNVTQGQQVAELGSTDADRPKLHFEIRRQGRPVDPMQYLPPR